MAKKRAQAMKSRFTSRFLPQVELSSQPDHALIDVITVPRDENSSPWRQLGKRVLWAFGIVVFVTVVVYLDGGGYSEDMSLLDSAYYAAVSLTTVGLSLIHI